jgi:hypothetical protein
LDCIVIAAAVMYMIHAGVVLGAKIVDWIGGLSLKLPTVLYLTIPLLLLKWAWSIGFKLLWGKKVLNSKYFF